MRQRQADTTAFKEGKASKEETTVGITLGNTKKAVYGSPEEANRVTRELNAAYRAKAKRKKAHAPTKKGERTAPVPDKVVVPSSRGRVLRADTPITSPYHVRARDKRYAPKNKKQERLIRKALKDSDAALGTKWGWYELYRTNRNDGNGFDKRRHGYKLYTFNEWIATEGKQYRV